MEKRNRFRIEKLEERIAPSINLFAYGSVKLNCGVQADACVDLRVGRILCVNGQVDANLRLGRCC